MKRKIYFRADASAQIGYGHFIRTLALADMLKEDFDCTFFTTSPTEYQIGEMKKVCPYVALREDMKFDNFLEWLQGDEIVVIDNYFFSTDYQRAIKALGCRLVCIDDMHDKHYVADAVINHAITDKSQFDCESYTKLCLGFEYALLRAPFLKKLTNNKRNNDMVVNFGGSDPFNTTERVVSMLLQVRVPYNLVVILGDDAYLSDDNKNKVKVYHNIEAEAVASLFEKSALGIFCTSTVCIEALSRGLKVIAGYDVGNQLDFYNVLCENRSIIPVGNLLETDVKILLEAICAKSTSVQYRFPADIKENHINMFKTLE